MPDLATNSVTMACCSAVRPGDCGGLVGGVGAGVGVAVTFYNNTVRELK